MKTNETQSAVGSMPLLGAVVKFKIKLCCNYGRNHRGWGQWHECTVPNESRYNALLKSLTDDPTVMAFETQRL